VGVIRLMTRVFLQKELPFESRINFAPAVKFSGVNFLIAINSLTRLRCQ